MNFLKLFKEKYFGKEATFHADDREISIPQQFCVPSFYMWHSNPLLE